MDDHFLNALFGDVFGDALDDLSRDVARVLQTKISAGLAARSYLSAHDKVRIAIIVAHAYRCDDALSGQLAQGRALGLNGAEMDANKAGSSHDASATEVMRFCAALLARPSTLTLKHFRQLRWAGYGDEAVEEIVMHLILHARHCLAARCAVPSTASNL